MDATASLMAMEASYFETRQTGNLMAVLSCGCSSVRGHCFGFIYFDDSYPYHIRNCLFDNDLDVSHTCTNFGNPTTPCDSNGRVVFTRVQRRYCKQRESTGGIVSILENVLSGIVTVQAYNASNFELSRVESESGEYRDQAIHAANLRNRFIPESMLLRAYLSPYWFLLEDGLWSRARLQ